MKTLKIIGLCILMGSLSSCELFRQLTGGQSGLKADVEAETLIEDGRRFMRSKQYVKALDAFEMAFDRDPHPQTSTALYYSGLAAYYATYYDIAEKRFEQLRTTFPRSQYMEEARYHLALIDLGSREYKTRKQGLNFLILLADQTADRSLQADITTHVREAFFMDFTLEELKRLKPSLKLEYRVYLEEAVLYKMIQAGQIEEARIDYQAFRLMNGEVTPYMSKILGEETELAAAENYLLFEPEIMRIALCLPLHSQSPIYGYEDKVPDNMTLGLEFYEGFQRGVAAYQTQSGKNIHLKVFDTRRDTATTARFIPELDAYAPTLLVGAIYNAQSRLLSTWAEARQVAQIIPISPTESLVEEKQFTFLGHPGSTTHGMRMAEYAYDGLALRQVYIFTDNKPGTAELSRGFSLQFTAMGGTVDTLEISSNYKSAIKEIPKLINKIESGEDTVGVYIPLLGNEESAGLIINLLRQRGKVVKIMGSPHFRARYDAIPRDIKEKYQVLFTTSHLVDEASKEYIGFYQSYLQDFGYPPSETVVQGFDLALYVLGRLDGFDPNMGYPVNTYLRAQESSSTMHIDYLFKGSQSNQAVNIGQYQEEGIIRVNR